MSLAVLYRYSFLPGEYNVIVLYNFHVLRLKKFFQYSDQLIFILHEHIRRRDQSSRRFSCAAEGNADICSTQHAYIIAAISNGHKGIRQLLAGSALSRTDVIPIKRSALISVLEHRQRPFMPNFSMMGMIQASRLPVRMIHLSGFSRIKAAIFS